MNEQYKELLELYADVKAERDRLIEVANGYNLEAQQLYEKNTLLHKDVARLEKKIDELLESRLPQARGKRGELAVKEIYYADEEVK